MTDKTQVPKSKMTEKIRIHNNPRQRKPKSKTKHDRENQDPQQSTTEKTKVQTKTWQRKKIRIQNITWEIRL